MTQCLAGGETDCPLGDKEMGSIQGGEIQTGGWRAFLDEVSQDLEDLRGVGDHSENFHGFVTTRAAQRALAGLRPAAGQGIRIDASTLKQPGVHSTMFLASRSFSNLRSRKNAMTLWRKQPLILARSMVGTWTNRPS